MKLELENIKEKFIIVVDGDEKKVVYDLDDSRIFSVHITGCGRGARNAVLSKSTFYNTKKEARTGINYLNTCNWNAKFKSIKVKDLGKHSEIGYKYLLEDIKWFNCDIDFENSMRTKRIEEEIKRQSKLKEKVIELINSMNIEIEQYCDEVRVILTEKL